MLIFSSLGRSLCIAFLLGSLIFSTSALALSEEKRQARLKELRETIEQLKRELNQVKTNRDQLMDDLQSSETKIGDLSKKIQELRKQLENKQSHLQRLKSEKEELSLAKKQQQGSVARHLNAAYRLGQQSSLKLLLNQQDPSLLARNLRYYRYFAATQAQEVGRYITTIQRLEELEPTIAAEADTIARSHNELRAKRDQLVASQAERKKTLAALERTISDTDAKLKSTEEDRHHLDKLLREVVTITRDMQIPANNQAFAKLKGQLPWPAGGKVLRSFGSPRVANKVRWQGVLIGAPEGSP